MTAPSFHHFRQLALSACRNPTDKEHYNFGIALKFLDSNFKILIYNIRRFATNMFELRWNSIQYEFVSNGNKYKEIIWSCLIIKVTKCIINGSHLTAQLTTIVVLYLKNDTFFLKRIANHDVRQKRKSFGLDIHIAKKCYQYCDVSQLRMSESLVTCQLRVFIFSIGKMAGT